RAWVLFGLLLLILPIGTATASTTVTNRAAGHLGTHVTGKPGAAGAVTVGTSTLLRFTPAVPGPTLRAGTQTGSATGLSGRTITLAACAVSPCTVHYRGAGEPRLRPGDFGILAHLTVLQPPAATGTATGFAFELAVKTTAGWTVARGYFSTGTNPSAATHTINLDFYIDLGVRIAPTILATDLVVDPCGAAVACP
ncbi:MAG: hypothetical protein L3K17_09425, partial [Thermoplasmata archaeon]|nr:hypothetical protein [Thermoplasmata archaeon]